MSVHIHLGNYIIMVINTFLIFMGTKMVGEIKLSLY